MSELFTLRAAEERDVPYLNNFTYAEGMDYLPNLDGVTVAVNSENEPVGFLRLVQGQELGVAYVNPVVTYKAWRGYGVGKALMVDAETKCNELRFVARGGAVAFYKHIGYENCSWELIEDGVSEDCANCTLVPECKPQPMRKIIK